MTPESYAFFTSDRDRIAEESDQLSFIHQVRAVVGAIATMTAAYFLWAQDFGSTGFAVFLIATSFLFIWHHSHHGGQRDRFRRVLLFEVGLVLGCVRLVWQTNAVICLAGFLHLLAIALAMQESQQGALRLFSFAFQSCVNGVFRWIHLPWIRIAVGISQNRLAWFSWGLPLLVSLLFMIPLIQSLPDLAAYVFRMLSTVVSNILNWGMRVNIVTAIIVTLVGIWSLGVLLPRYWTRETPQPQGMQVTTQTVSSQAVYLASRNTLILVSCVFVWFLGIEIRTTWFREFPVGFLYSTYAHQGAAWLTLALGMSTLALSILFHPQMHQHPRIASLQKLAGFWSLCNVLLVIAVFYRLMIYVNFNGMTRMRIVGFVGVACVFAGFVIVNVLIVRPKSVSWTIHKQCWALIWSIYVLALLPMDTISHRWNESSIRAGHLAPAVQFSVQTISDEGLLCLIPLLTSDELEIREGVKALLAERYVKTVDSQSETETSTRWTQFQGSKSLLDHRLQDHYSELEPFVLSIDKRRNAIDRLRSWTMQWY